MKNQRSYIVMSKNVSKEVRQGDAILINKGVYRGNDAERD